VAVFETDLLSRESWWVTRPIRSVASSKRSASEIEIPGRVLGMYNSVPSSRGGMNSAPRRGQTGMVAIARTETAPASVRLLRSDHATVGSYQRIIQRWTGCARSWWIVPTRAAFAAPASQRGRNRNGVTRVNMRQTLDPR
jgi:hypothetical protein